MSIEYHGCEPGQAWRKFGLRSGDRWILTSKELPPEGAEVETLGENGTQQTLVRCGSLWFYPDMSMYVYYTPMFWRQPIARQPGG